MVTGAAALVLKLRDAGRLALGGPADFIVVPPTHDAAADALLAARRGDLALVAVGGRPLVGQQRFAGVFKARRVGMHPIRVDGEPRMASARLARDLARCPIHEPGVVPGS